VRRVQPYRPFLADHDVPLLADAAEALGATHGGHAAGSLGAMAALSFKGNKIIITSGGGALVTDNADWGSRARWLFTQARDPAPHYQHSTVGYNYRLSNLLAALGRSQLSDLKRRVDIRRAHNALYREALGDLPVVEFMPEAPGNRSTFWLTSLTIYPSLVGIDLEQVLQHLETLDIESRPVWKPMHLPPVFSDCEVSGGAVLEHLFQNGLCILSVPRSPTPSVIRWSARIRAVFGRS
jgi:pyridoxal phosphate-dependent aminotransferase EpsN